MKAKKFLELVDEILNELKSSENKKAFSENMIYLRMEDMSFAEWMVTYLAWNELSSEEDIRTYYWHLEEE